jgi:hypothetical protein
MYWSGITVGWLIPNSYKIILTASQNERSQGTIGASSISIKISPGRVIGKDDTLTLTVHPDF